MPKAVNYAIENKLGRSRPAFEKIKHQEKVVLKFLTDHCKYQSVRHIYRSMVRDRLLRGDTLTETKDPKNRMTAITPIELKQRLKALYKSGMICEIQKTARRENTTTEIKVNFYGVKGADFNHSIAQMYTNFVANCRSPKYVYSEKRSDYMKNIVKAIIQELPYRTLISAKRVSDLSIDFTTDTVKKFLNK